MGAVESVQVHRLPPGPESIELHFSRYQFDADLAVLRYGRLVMLGLMTNHELDCDNKPVMDLDGFSIVELGVELNWKLELAKLRGYRFALCASAESLKRLPARCQEAFRLFYYCGMTHQEVAEEMGISAGRSRVYVCEARKLLESIGKRD